MTHADLRRIVHVDMDAFYASVEQCDNPSLRGRPSRLVFEQDLLTWDEAQAALAPILTKVWDACARGGHSGRSVTVKVKYSDFHQVTRSRTLPAPIDSRVRLHSVSVELLRPLFPPPRGVRLIGVTVSSLSSDTATRPAQLPLSFD